METGQKTTLISNRLEQISYKELSIQVSLNGFSFCILNKETNTICYAKQVSFEKKQTPYKLLDKLKYQFDSLNIYNHNFETIHVVHENELSTLVPKSIFSENHLADYLKFNSRILKSDFISFDDLLNEALVNVYVPYVNINNFLFDKFGAFEYKHFSTILIEYLLANAKHASQASMFAYVNKSHFEIVVLNSGKLKLYNTFEYKTKEDFLYYILFVAEQLQLNPEHFKLEVFGEIRENDALFEMAYKFIRNVSIYKTITRKIEDPYSSEIKDNIVLTHSF